MIEKLARKIKNSREQSRTVKNDRKQSKIPAHKNIQIRLWRTYAKEN